MPRLLNCVPLSSEHHSRESSRCLALPRDPDDGLYCCRADLSYRDSPTRRPFGRVEAKSVGRQAARAQQPQIGLSASALRDWQASRTDDEESRSSTRAMRRDRDAPAGGARSRCRPGHTHASPMQVSVRDGACGRYWVPVATASLASAAAGLVVAHGPVPAAVPLHGLCDVVARAPQSQPGSLGGMFMIKRDEPHQKQRHIGGALFRYDGRPPRRRTRDTSCGPRLGVPVVVAEATPGTRRGCGRESSFRMRPRGLRRAQVDAAPRAAGTTPPDYCTPAASLVLGRAPHDPLTRQTDTRDPAPNRVAPSRGNHLPILPFTVTGSGHQRQKAPAPGHHRYDTAHACHLRP